MWKDDPKKHMTTQDVIERFCNTAGADIPNGIEDTHTLLSRMRSVGMVTQNEINEHIEAMRREEALKLGPSRGH